MNCTHPIRLIKKIPRDIYPDGLEVPCGKCLNCRIQKRKEWALRCYHELSYHDRSSFVTLTYDEDHVPDNYSLSKHHVQKWLKRLRKQMTNSLKYFLCGEYGSRTLRPHYHALLYGIGLTNTDRNLVMSTWDMCDWSTQRKAFDVVCPETIEYVTGYIHSKLSGDQELYMYRLTQREIPFRLISHGIGLQYVNDNKDQLSDNMYVTQRGLS